MVAGKAKAKDPALVNVELLNATRTSGGIGPGVVSVPEDEAREMVQAGYAVTRVVVGLPDVSDLRRELGV